MHDLDLHCTIDCTMCWDFSSRAATEMEISSAIYKTPIGPLKLEATAEGICAVKWLFGKHSKSKSDSADHAEQESTLAIKEEDNGKASPSSVAVGASGSAKADEHLQVCKTWLDAYFAGTLLEFDPPKPALVLPESGILHCTFSSILVKLIFININRYGILSQCVEYSSQHRSW